HPAVAGGAVHHADDRAAAGPAGAARCARRGGGRGGHAAGRGRHLRAGLQPMPPLTPITWPLTQPAASEHRKATSAANSSGRPARAAGTICRIASGLNVPAVIEPSITPGATTFTVIPRLPISRASDLLAPCSAALAAA